MNCTWHIAAPLGSVVQLRFMTFVLEDDNDCSYDYVAVYDNSTNPRDLRQLGQ